MRPHTVEQTTLSGTAYDLDDDATLYVFPGFAFREAPVGSSGAPYVFSAAPATLDEVREGLDGTPIERTVYQTSSRAYITTESEAPPGVVDFLVNDIVYRYEESISTYNEMPSAYDDQTVETTEYIRLVNGWSDVEDLCVPRAEFDAAVEDEEILRLWPVWESAHR